MLNVEVIFRLRVDLSLFGYFLEKYIVFFIIVVIFWISEFCELFYEEVK